MKALEVIEAIARERCIDQQTVMEVMESILLEHAASKYGNADILKAKLFDDGSFEVYLEQTVVENKDENNFAEISLEKAKLRNPNAEPGNMMKEVLPFAVGKSDIEKIFLTLRSRLNAVQKAREYEIFHAKLGTVLTGYIKRVDMTEAIISFPEGEGVLRKIDMLPNDILRAGGYIKVYVKDVKQSQGRQVFLSRTHEGFLRELLKAEVPEIHEGLVEVKAVARDVGSLAKIAVHSTRSSINPISVCIGAYGSRIQAVTKELLGEKISVIEWNEDMHQFIANSLAPANVLKVIEKPNNRYEVVTSQDQFSKAMGRGGQNVILAKRLCNVNAIKLLTEEEEAKLYQEQIAHQAQSLINNLEIEDMMAHLLISENFTTIDKIATSPISEIVKLNGFDEELAQVLQDRAQDFINTTIANTKAELKKNGKDISLFDLMPLITLAHIETLIANNITQKSDLAMLDAGELKEIFDNEYDLSLSFDQSRAIIAAARGIKLNEVKKTNNDLNDTKASVRDESEISGVNE